MKSVVVKVLRDQKEDSKVEDKPVGVVLPSRPDTATLRHADLTNVPPVVNIGSSESSDDLNDESIRDYDILYEDDDVEMVSEEIRADVPPPPPPASPEDVETTAPYSPASPVNVETAAPPQRMEDETGRNESVEDFI